MYKIPTTARIVFALYLFLILIHISSIIGVDLRRLGAHFFILPIYFFFSLTPFWLLLILKFNRLVKGSSNDYVFKQIRSSLPPWILKFVIFNFVFGIGNFFYSFVTKNFDNVFSSHLSMFYAITIAGLTGIANFNQKLCTNGHEIKIDASFCPVCGIKI